MKCSKLKTIGIMHDYCEDNEVDIEDGVKDEDE